MTRLDRENYEKIKKSIYNTYNKIYKRISRIQNYGDYKDFPSYDTYLRVVDKYKSLRNSDTNVFKEYNKDFRLGQKLLSSKASQELKDLERDLKYLDSLETTRVKGAKKFLSSDMVNFFKNLGSEKSKDVKSIYNMWLQKENIPQGYFSSEQEMRILDSIDKMTMPLSMTKDSGASLAINNLSKRFKWYKERAYDDVFMRDKFSTSIQSSSSNSLKRAMSQRLKKVKRR